MKKNIYVEHISWNNYGSNRPRNWLFSKNFSLTYWLFVVSSLVVSNCDPIDGNPACQAPLSMGTFEARILEWVAMPSSRGSSQPRNQIGVSCIAGRFFTCWATRETLKLFSDSMWVHLPKVDENSWNFSPTAVVMVICDNKHRDMHAIFCNIVKRKIPHY